MDIIANELVSEKLRSHVDNVIEKFGNGFYQLDILQEECAELFQAISKYKRNKNGSRQMIIEEMTHVLISSCISAKYLDIDPEDIVREIKKEAGSNQMITQSKHVL